MKTLFDFKEPESILSWTSVDDRVMGGISRSRLQHHPEGYAIFCGEVSFANQGGFASVRCSPANFSTPGAWACRLRVRGDGKRYKLLLRSRDRFDEVGYQAGFETTPGEWVTMDLPLAGFVPKYRGKLLPDAPPLDPTRLSGVGLMITERQAGPFRLEIESIMLASSNECG